MLLPSSRILPLLLAFSVGCQSAPSASRAVNESRPTSTEPSAFSRDLTRDEAAGGHTLRKHVGRTDGDLRERLRRERHIAAASTYTDREVAEHAVGAAIQQEQSRIDSWLARSSGHPNLVLDYDADHSIGRTMHRGQEGSDSCSHAVVVLKWIEPTDYYVLTSYPECR